VNTRRSSCSLLLQLPWFILLPFPSFPFLSILAVPWRIDRRIHHHLSTAAVLSLSLFFSLLLDTEKTREYYKYILGCCTLYKNNIRKRNNTISRDMLLCIIIIIIVLLLAWPHYCVCISTSGRIRRLI
jgi:hypothetical protein